ncbi:MAG: RsmE family RNA methyltransferase [Planctomycetota bacterium]
MSHLKRFYFDGQPGCDPTNKGQPSGDPTNKGQPQADKIILDPAQSHHLKDVLRLKQGSDIEVFNSRGDLFLARVSAVGKDRVVLDILETRLGQTPQLHITVASAIPKGSRMDWLVEKAAELGASEFIPIITRRSVIRDADRKLHRWQNIAVAAAKQTGQNTLLHISPPVAFSRIISQASSYDLVLIAVPSAPEGSLEEMMEKSGNPRRILYLIGPEGDFTDDEVEQAVRAGFKSVRLPVASILRVETAAIALLAMIFYAVKKT